MRTEINTSPIDDEGACGAGNLVAIARHDHGFDMKRPADCPNEMERILYGHT